MNPSITTKRNYAAWAAQIIAAIIFAQTLFFKFTGAEESVYIFSMLGVEPYGRLFAGVSELVAALLLLHPKYNWMGAFLGMGILAGAILSHLFVLGIVVQNDGGLLFGLALIAFITCAIVFILRRTFWMPLVLRFG